MQNSTVLNAIIPHPRSPKEFLKNIGWSLRHPNLQDLIGESPITDDPASYERRILFDYLQFRRWHFAINQFLTMATAFAALIYAPSVGVLCAFLLLQANEFIFMSYYAQTAYRFQDRDFHPKHWRSALMAMNSVHALTINLVFVVFAIHAPANLLFPTAATYLVVIVMLAPMNFFSIKFNMFSSFVQLFFMSIFWHRLLLDRGLTAFLDVEGFALIPVGLSFFASILSLRTFVDYYRRALCQEEDLYVAHKRLVQNSEILAREKDLISSIQSTISEGIVVIDKDGAIRRANQAFYELFDLNVRQTGLRIDRVFPKDIIKSDGKKRAFDTEDGRHFLVSGAPLKSEDESALRLFVVIDVTEKIKSDQIAMQAQKLSALGTLSGGIAHDFHNSLAVIRANADLILQSDNLSQSAAAQMNDILFSVENATGLTRQILAFSRATPMKSTEIEPARILEETQQLVRNLIAPRHHLRLICETKLQTICDPLLLKNALINLILYARDALPEGGEITLSAREENDGKIAFCVEDEGTGIDAKHLAHVVEPFFTLKDGERGTGIGLALVKQFAERSDGEFHLFSELGKGTRACISLPKRDVSAPRQAANDMASPSFERDIRKTVLVVDDNVLLAKSLVAQLSAMGCVAQVAHSLDEVMALDDLKQFDLVLCDIVLKQETGVDIYHHIRGLGCDVPFLFVTGNIAPELRKELRALGFDHPLEKPVGISRLSREVKAAAR